MTRSKYLFIAMVASTVVAGITSLEASASDNGLKGCDGSAIFVFVPPGEDRHKYLADYVRTHKGPSDAELKECNLTREQWRTEVQK